MRALRLQGASSPVGLRPARGSLYLAIPYGLLVISLLLTWTEPTAGTLGTAMVLGWTVVVNPCGVAHAGALGPSLHGVKGRNLWWRMIAAYTLVGLISASVVGAALGGAGLVAGSMAPDAGSMAVLSAVFLICFLHTLFPTLFRLPEIRRQTRARWFPCSEVTNAALWGADVGLTFATWITFPGAWALAAMAVVSASPLFGAGLFACYWLGRAVPHWVEPLLFSTDLRTGSIMQTIVAKHHPMRVLHGIGLIVLLGTLWAH